MKQLLFDVLIWIVERELYATPVQYALDEKRRETYLRQLWDLPGFREMSIERETRIVYSLAKETDLVKQAQMRGQRIENMLNYTRAKRAFEKHVSFTKGAAK